MNFIFYLSKIVWLLVQPLNLVAVLVVAAALCAWLRRAKLARNLITFAAALLVLPVVLPIDRWLLAPLETRFSDPNPWPSDVDGILLLGGAQKPRMTAHYGVPEVNAAAETLITFLALARRYPNARLAFSGGSGDMFHQELSEVMTVKLFLREQGFDDSRVVYESRSRNTYENALLSKRLLQPKAGERWMVITNARTVPRAIGIFRQVGWEVIPIPRDHLVVPDSSGWFSPALLDAYSNLSQGVYEWLGLVAHYASGRTNALFPRP
jgi:uncharacterized SAM-binding protein YcdF (DUF218 family)